MKFRVRGDQLRAVPARLARQVPGQDVQVQRQDRRRRRSARRARRASTTSSSTTTRRSATGIPNGLTIAPSALPEAKLIVVGTFGNLTAAQAATIKAGTDHPGHRRRRTGRRDQAAAAARVRAARQRRDPGRRTRRWCPPSCGCRASCARTQGQPECVGGGFSVQPTTLLFLDMPFGKVPFQIDQVRSIAAARAGARDGTFHGRSARAGADRGRRRATSATSGTSCRRPRTIDSVDSVGRRHRARPGSRCRHSAAPTAGSTTMCRCDWAARSRCAASDMKCKARGGDRGGRGERTGQQASRPAGYRPAS